MNADHPLAGSALPPWPQPHTRCQDTAQTHLSGPSAENRSAVCIVLGGGVPSGHEAGGTGRGEVRAAGTEKMRDPRSYRKPNAGAGPPPAGTARWPRTSAWLRRGLCHEVSCSPEGDTTTGSESRPRSQRHVREAAGPRAFGALSRSLPCLGVMSIYTRLPGISFVFILIHGIYQCIFSGIETTFHQV